MDDTTQSADYWDARAERFDEEPDHGLRDPRVRQAWAARLRTWLPSEASDVLDLGCGTGSLALLAAEAGHRVTALDRSPRMAALARAKLSGTPARVLVADAARPPVPAGSFDVVLVRHVLWALPDPAAVLRHWAGLLRPGGRLVLVEGRWNSLSPVGIAATALAELAAPLGGSLLVEQLGGDPGLWGRAVDDERYAAVIRPAARPAGRHTEIVDVHLLLLRGEEVLLARRTGTGYADGLLDAPSGHLEEGEDVRSGMIREAREEIGIDLDPDRLEAVLVMQHRAPGGTARVGWFFTARHDPGDPEPVNREPDRCSELRWCPLDALPDDMVAYCRAGIGAYRAGHRFLLHLHEPEDTIAYASGGPDRAVPLGAVRCASIQAMSLKITVDPGATAPPYEQLRAQIAERARTGELPVHYKLPTVRGLAEELGLAANTVAKAYRALEADGVIETRGRHGTYIAAGDAHAREVAAAASAYVERVRRLGLDRDAARAAVEEALRAGYREARDA